MVRTTKTQAETGLCCHNIHGSVCVILNETNFLFLLNQHSQFPILRKLALNFYTFVISFNEFSALSRNFGIEIWYMSKDFYYYYYCEAKPQMVKKRLQQGGLGGDDRQG